MTAGVTGAVAPADPEIPFGPGAAPAGATASRVHTVGATSPNRTVFVKVSLMVVVFGTVGWNMTSAEAM